MEIKKAFSLLVLIILTLTLSSCDGVSENQNIKIYPTEKEIIYVDKEIVIIETVIEYVEVPTLITETDVEIIYVEIPCIDCETTLIANAEHQDYLDWFEEYEDLLDDFINRLYKQTFYFDDLLEDYEQYLYVKMENGEVLTPEEIEFLLDYQERLNEWFEFENWIDEELEPIYNDLMGKFPKEKIN